MSRLPKFPTGAKRGSAAYKKWAREYARAKRKIQAAFDKDVTPSDFERAAVEFLVAAVQTFPRVGGAWAVPDDLWPQFVSLKRKSSGALRAPELDILLRCERSDVLRGREPTARADLHGEEGEVPELVGTKGSDDRVEGGGAGGVGRTGDLGAATEACNAGVRPGRRNGAAVHVLLLGEVLDADVDGTLKRKRHD